MNIHFYHTQLKIFLVAGHRSFFADFLLWSIFLLWTCFHHLLTSICGYFLYFFAPRSFPAVSPSSLLSYSYHLSSSVLRLYPPAPPHLCVRLVWPTWQCCPFQHRPLSLSQLLSRQICFLFGPDR